ASGTSRQGTGSARSGPRRTRSRSADLASVLGRDGALEGVSRRQPDAVEVTHDDPVRLEQGRLRERDAATLAVLLHDLIRSAQSGARHVREKVVLDLVVETAHERIHE